MQSQGFGTSEVNCTFGDVPDGAPSEDLGLDESLDLLFCGAELKENMLFDDGFSVHDGSGKGPGNLLTFDFD